MGQQPCCLTVLYSDQYWLYDMLASYISSMLSHGNASVFYLEQCTQFQSPVTLANAEKYKALTLCSSITKLFELVVLELQSAALTSNSLKLGYKVVSSTALCTTLLWEVACKCVTESCDVYCLLLEGLWQGQLLPYISNTLGKEYGSMYIRCLLYMHQH